MRYRFVFLPEFTVVGPALQTSVKEGRNVREIPEFWREFHHNGCEKLLPPQTEPGKLYGLCIDADEHGNFTYMIGGEVPADCPVPEGMIKRTVPKGMYAAFTAVGDPPAAVPPVWRQIFDQWLPNSPYKHTGGPDFELYEDSGMSKDPQETDIYIPIDQK